MEEKKTAEILKGIWESLTEEQKEKAKTCKTAEELARLAASEGIELPDEALDAASGGVVVKILGPNTFSSFNADGDYIDNFRTLEEAKASARAAGASDDLVSKTRLDQIRHEADQKKKNSGC